MGWFKYDSGARIEQLEKEALSLADRVSRLEWNATVRVGEIDYFASIGCRPDDRPKVSLKDVVQMLMDNVGVEFVHTAAKEKIELKPKAMAAKSK